MRISRKLALALLLSCFGRLQAQQQQTSAVSASELFKAASPSVVLIEIYGNDGKVLGSGSGFIVTADGEILTNYHVIAHTKRATVKLANGDAYDDVAALDLDKRKDIALIKIKAIGLSPLKLGHSNVVQVGDPLYALGNPLGLFQNTLSEGILSGIRQADGFKLFQLSVPVSHGSSGSPVFDSHGTVIGIVEATIDEGQNLNFAIPIDYALGMLDSRVPHSLESTYEPEETKESDKPETTSQPEPAVAKVPEGLKSDTFTYVAGKLGNWTKDAADRELGQPYTRRDSVNINGGIIGDIFKYKSPNDFLASIELNFDRGNGALCGAYFYPNGVLTWQAVRERLGHNYTKKKEKNGTVFYTYQVLQHQRAVLVDSVGNVISIGVW
jgi:hypothetical protein